MKKKQLAEKTFTLLIADKNPNVRKYLQREMAAEGYRIRLAENGKQALEWTYDNATVDLIILDPDLPDMENCRVLKSMLNRIPPLPIVVHTFMTIYAECPRVPHGTVFVEKQGNSIDRLKRVVDHMLHHPRKYHTPPTWPDNNDLLHSDA